MVDPTTTAFAAATTTTTPNILATSLKPIAVALTVHHQHDCRNRSEE